MAKLAYSKIASKANTEILTYTIDEDKVVEVLQYLPVADKLALISKVVEFAHDIEHNYADPIKTEVYLTIELITRYTNITFTDKQKEDIPKLYDCIISSSWYSPVIGLIPETERVAISSYLKELQDAFYKYRNSVMGILDNISTDYSDLDLDITKLQQKLANGENIELVKNIMDKLG
jgi:hypothetical protein